MSHKLVIFDETADDCVRADPVCPLSLTSADGSIVVAEGGTTQQPEIDLSVSEFDVNVANISFDADLGILTIVETDGETHQVDISDLDLSVAIQNEGVQIAAAVNSINFVGGAVVVSNSNSEVTLTINQQRNVVCFSELGLAGGDIPTTQMAAIIIDDVSDPAIPVKYVWSCSEGAYYCPTMGQTCDEFLLTFDGAFQRQKFITASDLELNEVQLGWGISQAQLIQNVSLTSGGIDEALSGALTDGRPTLNSTILNYNGTIGSGSAQIVNTQDNIASNLVFSEQSQSGEIWIFTLNLTRACDNFDNVRLRHSAGAAHCEAKIYLWDGAGFDANVATASSTAYFRRTSSSVEVQEVVSVDFEPGKNVGLLVFAQDPWNVHELSLQASVNGGGWIALNSATAISNLGFYAKA